MASAAVHPKVVILFVLIPCLLFLPLFVGVRVLHLFCNAVLFVYASSKCSGNTVFYCRLIRWPKLLSFLRVKALFLLIHVLLLLLLCVGFCVGLRFVMLLLVYLLV